MAKLLQKNIFALPEVNIGRRNCLIRVLLNFMYTYKICKYVYRVPAIYCVSLCMLAIKIMSALINRVYVEYKVQQCDI